jgi:hypothetical protein
VNLNAVNLAIVTSGSAGWKTVRTRWEIDLAGYAPSLHHIEDHARLVTSLTERFGAKSIGHALAGRAAARAGAIWTKALVVLGPLALLSFLTVGSVVSGAGRRGTR